MWTTVCLCVGSVCLRQVCLVQLGFVYCVGTCVSLPASQVIFCSRQAPRLMKPRLSVGRAGLPYVRQGRTQSRSSPALQDRGR